MVDINVPTIPMVFKNIGIQQNTPYLSRITNDMFLLYTVFHSILDEEERSTVGTSIYYSKQRKSELKDYLGREIINIGTSNSNEFSIDVSYGLKISNFYTMSVTIRYIRLDLLNNLANLDPVKC
ncbi:MAG: hypothetical protein ACMUEM_03960 [Flavobacteriales bacterium AspAUS03]